MSQVNILCLKWGQLYGPEYVNILYGMVARHLAHPFRFVCFTDDANGIRPEVDIQPLPNFPEPSWKYARYCSAWRKLALFEAGLADLKGMCLFMDLDIVVLDSLDDFFDRDLVLGGDQADIAMIENWYQPGKGQASVMAFEAGKPEYLLRDYLKDPIAVLEAYPTEQAYISGAAKSRCRFFPEAWSRSYKMHSMPSGFSRFYQKTNQQPSTRVLVFHGRPNPPDAIAGVWGKTIPWYKRWAKPIHPSPWLEAYWRD